MAFGASSIVHTAKLIEISQDLPIVIEIVDHEEKINAFVAEVDKLREKANCGGLITLEKAEVLYYKHGSKK
jgi:PII-like signaling protein